jgi:outer membrane protein assembly factor BamB
MRFRLAAAALAFVTASSIAAASPLPSIDVTDYGRTRFRTHYTPQEPEYPLLKGARAVWEVPLGISRSQPLVIARDWNGDGRPEVRIFHVAGDMLWALNGEITPAARPDGLSAEEYRRQLRDEGFILWSLGSGSVCTDKPLLAGDELLRLRCQRMGARREERPFASSQASYVQGPTPDQDVIYVGYGHPASVAAIRAVDGKLLGAFVVDTDGDRGIVAAPLPFSGDRVVIGTTYGEVYLVRGLTTGVASVRGVRIGGRISSSPVPVGEHSFIIASDARHEENWGTHGYLIAITLGQGATGLHPFRPSWPAAILTQAGIPGEVAIDSRTIYMADKYGKLYALALDTGQLLWCRQFPVLNACQPGQTAVTGFINMNPT